MVIKKVNTNIFKVMFLSIFLISFYIRQPLLKDLSSMNLLFLLSLAVLLFINIKKYMDMKKALYITAVIFYIVVQDYLINGNNINTIVCNIGMYIVPIYILSISYKSIDIEGIFKSFLKVLNIAVVIIFVIGLIDPVMHFSIMKFLGQHLVPGINSNIIKNTQSISEYRYTSFLGHALFTKELFLYFYLLNDIYSRKFNKELMKKGLVSAIALIGVLLTGSKSGTVLIISTLLISQINNLKKSITILLIFLITFEAGFFNVVLDRFNKGDLTTGRDVAWQQVVNSGIDPYRVFSGYGENAYARLNEVIETKYVTAALEYPAVILALKYGLLCTGLILAIVYIYPLIYILRKKEYYILFAYIIKLIDINTYNGLIYKADNMILFLIFSYILMGVCGIGKNNEES